MAFWTGLFGGGIKEAAEGISTLAKGLRSAVTGKLPPEEEAALNLKLAEIEQQADQLATSDRDSARKREMEVKDKTPSRLAWVMVAGFFVILALLIFVTIPTTAKDALLIMLGTLSSGIMSVLQYYFGSSSGSADKSKLIEQMMNK
jgi:hypothetical protein